MIRRSCLSKPSCMHRDLYGVALPHQGLPPLPAPHNGFWGHRWGREGPAGVGARVSPGSWTLTGQGAVFSFAIRNREGLKGVVRYQALDCTVGARLGNSRAGLAASLTGALAKSVALKAARLGGGESTASLQERKPSQCPPATPGPAAILPLGSLHIPLIMGHWQWDGVLHPQHPCSTGAVFVFPAFHPTSPGASPPKSPHKHEHFSLFSPIWQYLPGTCTLPSPGPWWI